MDFVDWCKLAQSDQIDEKRSIIYANLGHTIKRDLIDPDGLSIFCQCLDKISDPFSGPLRPDESDEYGLSAIAVDRASEALYRVPESTRPSDFRLSGHIVNVNEPLINVYYRAVVSTVLRSSTGGMTGSPTPYSPGPSAPKPYRVVWLTRISNLIEALKKTRSVRDGTKLTTNEFFSEIVALLGLRYHSDAERHGCRLQVFRPNQEGVMRRPHVLSRGYPERFCGVSRFRPFGSTADNRTGKAGLPETIAFATELDEQKPGSSDYENTRRALDAFADFAAGDDGNYLETEMLTSEFHHNDDKIAFRKEVLNRLSPVGCNTHCDGPGSINCMCS